MQFSKKIFVKKCGTIWVFKQIPLTKRGTTFNWSVPPPPPLSVIFIYVMGVGQITEEKKSDGYRWIYELLNFSNKQDCIYVIHNILFTVFVIDWISLNICCA